MKHFRKIIFSFTLQGISFSSGGFPSGGYELFCHDWIVVPGITNRVLSQTHSIILHSLQLPITIPINNYGVFSWTAPAVPLGPIAVNIPPIINVQQQAMLAIKRFLIGITNGRENLDNFRYPGQIVGAATGGVINGYVMRALICGGYNTPAAYFLYHLLLGGGFPPNLGGAVGGNPNTVAIVLSLNERVSKDLKEIHWNSSSALQVDPQIVGAMSQAFPWAIPPMPPQGILPPTILNYQSIKFLLNGFFPPFHPPHSATIVTYQRTSNN